MAPVKIGMRFPVAILFANSITITLAAASVCLRIWSQALRKVSLQGSDYFICFSWLFNFGLAICANFAVTRGGAGKHQKDVTLPEVESALKTSNHIFPNRTFHRISYLVMAMLASYGIAFAITSLASCKPFAFNWNKEFPHGTCIDTSKFYTAQTVLGVIFDVIVVALPMPILWGLQMRVQKKVALTCIFGVGLLVCIISAFRAALNLDVHLQKTDFPRYAGIALILAIFENNLSIICASLPVMQPILTSLSQIIKSTFSRSSSPSRTNNSSRQRFAWSSKGRRQRQQMFGTSNGGCDLEAGAKFKQLHDHLYPLASTQISYGGNTSTNSPCYDNNVGSGEVVVEMDE